MAKLLKAERPVRLHRSLKKIAIVCVAALCACVLAVPIVALATSSSSTDAIDTSWYLDDEGQSSYTITNAAQLRGLAALVNGTATDENGALVSAVDFKGVTIYQGNSINLCGGNAVTGYTAYEFVPIGTKKHPFAGTYTARSGKTISGLCVTQMTQYAGLFGCATADSAINGVALKTISDTSNTYGEVTATSKNGYLSRIGGVVGYTAGSLTDCSSNIPITVTSTGEAASTADQLKVVQYVGGVAGYVCGDMSSCSYVGMLDVSIASAAYAPDTSSESLCVGDSFGGVVGRFGDPDAHGTMTDCHNSGTVWVRATGPGASDRFGTVTYARPFFVAGVVGYSNGSIIGCSNGTYNELRTEVTGGIVSTSALDSATGEPLNNRGADQTAGVCGGLRSVSDDPDKYNDGDPADPMVIQNCYNEGMVTGACASGGIVGETGVYCTVSMCRNGHAGDSAQSTQVAGKVVSTRWNKPMSAGICGRTNGGTITYCANYAEIRNVQTGYYMAGIVGGLFVSDDYPDVVPEVYGCLNTGGIYTINATKTQDFREAGICGSNEGYLHDCLSMDGSVPYHDNACVGDNNWGLWSNLESRDKESLQSSNSAAYLNAVAAQNQDWNCYWFVNRSGFPTLSVWEDMSEENRIELTADMVESITQVEAAPYVGGEGGSVPTLKVVLKDGTELVQNADFYVIAQEGAVEMTEGTPYKASIVGLGMYCGELKDCANYGIGASSLGDAVLAVGDMSYNGGKVIFPTSVVVRIGANEVQDTEFDYVIYSYHVDRTSVQEARSGCTVAFDSAGFVSLAKDGSDKVSVKEYGVEKLNSAEEPYWLWDRNGELISDSTGTVYYTSTSGGGVAGTAYGENESCLRLKTGMPTGYVVKAEACTGSSSLTGSVLGSFVVKTVDLYRGCTFTSVEVNGETWYWDADTQEFYECDEQGERIAGMPQTTFTGETVSLSPVITCALADGSEYQLIEGTDFKVVCGDPDAEEESLNRNVTDYSSDPMKRAAITIRPIDTSCYSNYIVGYFGIEAADLADCKISLDADTWAYTGKAIEPAVTVRLNGVELALGIDYTVKYSNNVSKGTASYTVTALGNLKGGTKTKVTGTFTIGTGKDISGWSIDAVDDQQFNYGYDVHPKLVFRNAKGVVQNLEEGKDYVVEYSTTDVTKCTGTNPNGTDITWNAAKKCTATVTGIGLCAGTLTTTFDIVPYDARANATNQLRVATQDMSLEDWSDGTQPPYNMGTSCPVVSVYALPIVDWAAYEAGDLDAAYGERVVIGSDNNNVKGALIQQRPVRYYTYNASATDGLGTLVSRDGKEFKDYDGKTVLSPQKAQGNQTFTATVALRVSTSGSQRNGAVGILNAGTFTVTEPIELIFDAGEGTGTAPSGISAEPGSSIALPSAGELSLEGSQFAGWLCNETGRVYAASETYDMPEDATASPTFTAQWALEGQTRTSIADAEIGDISSQAYTGKKLYPALSVYVDGVELTEGTDYETAYSSNVSVGTASVRITGIGDYMGFTSTTFSIVKGTSKVAVKSSSVEKVYGADAFTNKLTTNVGDGKVTYKSSNTAVVKVSSTGKVTVKGVGTATITVSKAATANYKSASTKYTVKVKPKKAVVSTLTSGAKKLTVKMSTKASSKGGTGYQIAYRVKGTSKWKYTTTTSQTKTIKSLKKGKTYQIKVRAYKKVGSTKIYGAWSKVKTSKKIQ